MSYIFFKGLLLGFSVAAPVGPIGLLCISRTLRLSVRHGLLTGLGAATADAVYGLVAALGLTVISQALLDHQRPIRLVGGVLLLWLGVKVFRSRPGSVRGDAPIDSLAGTYLSAVVLTITSPATILSFTAAFAALGLGAVGAPTYGGACVMVGGVFLGSSLWWLLLSTGTGRLRDRLTPDRMVWVNRASGAILAGFAAWAIAGAIH